ncbi:MAG TPA: hypothetical protein VM935_01405 [Chitinophagaceae bacterium]|nr:hypothetical protein [Chitinophagaceae bacterium]
MVKKERKGYVPSRNKIELTINPGYNQKSIQASRDLLPGHSYEQPN